MVCQYRYVKKVLSLLGGWGVFVLYFAVLSFFLWHFTYNLVWMWAGAVVGLVILGLDHVAYVVAYPYELTPQRVIQTLRAKQFKEALLVLVRTNEERTKLFLRQALGQVVLLVLGFYLLTSNGSFLAKGLILSANLGILTQIWAGYLGDTARLKSWLFQNVRGEVSNEALRGYVFVVTIVFLGLTFLAVKPTGL